MPRPIRERSSVCSSEAIHHEAFYKAQHVIVGPEAKLIRWDNVSHIIEKRKRKIESPWIKEGGKAASKKASYDRCVWKRYKPVDSVFCKKENGAQRGAIRRGKFNVTMPRGPEYPGLSILHANGDAVIAENSAAGQTCQKPRDGALACAGLTDKQVAIASIIDDAACVQVCASPERKEPDEEELIQRVVQRKERFMGFEKRRMKKYLTTRKISLHAGCLIRD